MKNEKSHILETKELFSVDFGDGDIERMICQTYTDMPPFYSIKKAYNRVPVETASHDISEIIRHLKRGIRIAKTTLREDFVKQNPKVKAIYLDVIAKQQMFLDKTIAISI